MTNHFTSCKSSLYAKVSFVDCEYSPEKRRVFLVLQVRKEYLTCKSILQLVSPCFFFSLRMLRLMVLSHTIFSKIVVVLMICWDLDQALTLRQHCRMQRNCAGRLWTKKSQQSEDKHDKYISKYKKHIVKLVPQSRMGREAITTKYCKGLATAVQCQFLSKSCHCLCLGWVKSSQGPQTTRSFSYPSKSPLHSDQLSATSHGSRTIF